MIGTHVARPRVLVADGDSARRARTRRDLSDEFVVTEASSAEEALAWLEDQAPGVTLADFRLPGAAGAELVARIRELAPHELVLILAPDPSLGLCRAAMRAGAYDCVDSTSLPAEQLRAICDGALTRLEEAQRTRRLAEDLSRGAVRRHEREAAARLSTPAAAEAWQAADADARERWLHDYLQAVEAPTGSADRARLVDDLARDVLAQAKPGEALTALHLHATVAARSATMDEAMDRARECLVEALAKVADGRPARATGSPLIPSLPAREPRPSPIEALAWHRWRLSETKEEWTLVVAGRPLARVSPAPAGCRGELRSPPDGDLLESVELPPVPEALREVERRLGLPYVLTVHTARVG